MGIDFTIVDSYKSELASVCSKRRINRFKLNEISREDPKGSSKIVFAPIEEKIENTPESTQEQWNPELSARWALDHPLWPLTHVPYILVDFGDIDLIQRFLRPLSHLPRQQQFWKEPTTWQRFIETVGAVEALLATALKVGTIGPSLMRNDGGTREALSRDTVIDWAQNHLSGCPLLKPLPVTKMDNTTRDRRIRRDNLTMRVRGETSVVKKLMASYKLSQSRIKQILRKSNS